MPILSSSLKSTSLLPLPFAPLSSSPTPLARTNYIDNNINKASNRHQLLHHRRNNYSDKATTVGSTTIEIGASKQQNPIRSFFSLFFDKNKQHAEAKSTLLFFQRGWTTHSDRYFEYWRRILKDLSKQVFSINCMDTISTICYCFIIIG